MLCYLGLCYDPRKLKSPAHCERAGSTLASGTVLLNCYFAETVRFDENFNFCVFMPCVSFG